MTEPPLRGLGEEVRQRGAWHTKQGHGYAAIWIESV
jgi:hypothetical protein